MPFELQDAAFTKLLTLNVQRVFSLTQLCLPLLRNAAEQGGKSDESYLDPARIINVSDPSFSWSTYRLSDALWVYFCRIDWVCGRYKHSGARDVCVLVVQSSPASAEQAPRLTPGAGRHHQQYHCMR